MPIKPWAHEFIIDLQTFLKMLSIKHDKEIRIPEYNHFSYTVTCYMII